MKKIILLLSLSVFFIGCAVQQNSELDNPQKRFSEMPKPAVVVASFVDPYYNRCSIQVRAANGEYHAFHGNAFCFNKGDEIK